MREETLNKLIFFTLALIALLLSQASSYLVNTNLAIGETHVINSALHFTHVRNFGGIFGSFQGQGWVFASFSVIILSGLSLYVLKSKLQSYEYIGFGIILGAGASNILDRLIYGSVIDFINVQGIPYWHYVFNTADTLIHVGVWPMLFFTFLDIRKEPETDEE
jgi:signal peptidase II